MGGTVGKENATSVPFDTGRARNIFPSHAEVFLPSAVLGLVVAFILTLVIFRERRRSKHDLVTKLCRQFISFVNFGQPDEEDKRPVLQKIFNNGDSLMNDFDREVVTALRHYGNHPRELFYITIPAFTSIVMSTLTLLIYVPLVDFMWPGRGRQPSINTAVTCFLAPAGLVYALSFGFVFQQTLIKHKEVLEKVSNELSLMDQMLTMTTKLNLPTKRHTMALFKAIKSELVFTAMLMQDREATSFKMIAPKNIKVHVWSVIDILKDAATHQEPQFNMNTVLVDKMIEYLIQLNNICTDRMGTLHTRIHPFKWVFLEVLGIITLFGVMLIDTESRLFVLSMCELTMFSTSALCFVMADYDSPFNGFFRVDLSILPDVVMRIEELYAKEAAGAEQTKMTSSQLMRKLKQSSTSVNMNPAKRNEAAENNLAQP